MNKPVSDVNNCEVMKGGSERTGMSYFHILRITLLIFFIFTVGSAFYLSDGFIYYYASFSDYLPTFALVLIFWSSVAVVISILIWASGRTVECISCRAGYGIKMEHYLIFMCLFLILLSAVWGAKPYVVSRGTTLNEKLITLLSIISIAGVLSWISRSKAERWFQVINERTIRSVKFVSFIVVLSVFVLIYYLV